MLLQHICDGVGNVRVGTAAADVAAHLLTDLCARFRMTFRNETGRRAELARRAIAALEGITLDESGLQWMQFAIRSKTLDGRNLRAVLGDGEDEATIYPFSIDQHRAGAALSLVASFLGARKLQLLTQQIEKGDPWFDRQDMANPIDGEVQ